MGQFWRYQRPLWFVDHFKNFDQILLVLYLVLMILTIELHLGLWYEMNLCHLILSFWLIFKKTFISSFLFPFEHLDTHVSVYKGVSNKHSHTGLDWACTWERRACLSFWTKLGPAQKLRVGSSPSSGPQRGFWPMLKTWTFPGFRLYNWSNLRNLAKSSTYNYWTHGLKPSFRLQQHRFGPGFKNLAQPYSPSG